MKFDGVRTMAIVGPAISYNDGNCGLLPPTLLEFLREKWRVNSAVYIYIYIYIYLYI